MYGLLATATFLAMTTLAIAQTVGRPQDGFYSGQSNGQSVGQATGRVDGRANHQEGVPPAAGDAIKNAPPVTSGVPQNAESMDVIVRPGLQR